MEYNCCLCDDCNEFRYIYTTSKHFKLTSHHPIWNIDDTDDSPSLEILTNFNVKLIEPGNCGWTHAQSGQGRWISVINGNCCVISGFVIANVRCRMLTI